VSIVAPFLNEGEAVQSFYQAITAVVDQVSEASFEIICVDDGSTDDTLARLIAITVQDHRFRVVELSRNFGKEAALTAGIDEARGDAVIPIDADLQDPPELIPLLVSKWLAGADVVLARRSDRSSDHPLKRKTAALFYRLHNSVSSVQIPDNVGDFRLMNRDSIDALKRLGERQRFMKGLFAWVGFRTTVVEYSRKPRSSGSSKFSGWRLWNFALEGITSFSSAPLRVWSYVGLSGALLSFAYGSYIVIRTLLYGIDMPGYASILAAVLFMGSLQLMSVGMIGEYIGRMYMETKQRPPYIVRKVYSVDHES